MGICSLFTPFTEPLPPAGRMALGKSDTCLNLLLWFSWQKSFRVTEVFFNWKTVQPQSVSELQLSPGLYWESRGGPVQGFTRPQADS